MNFFEPENYQRLEFIEYGNAKIRIGERVTLRPKSGRDVFDLALAGKTAKIVAFEETIENRILVAVVIDSDDGADFGEAWQTAHRFFFDVDEIELTRL